MTKKKIALICLLTVILCIMTLGYAALQEQIDITGTSSIDSIYKVEITKVTEAAKTGNAVSKEVPSYTKMNATFGVSLTKIEDTITYNIEISNLGTVDAKLNNAQITVEGSNDIKVTKSGIKNGDILLAGESKVMTIKIDCTKAVEGTIKVTLDYTRLKGGTGEVVEETESTELGYIKDGLILHYDGINNTRSGHDPSATSWEDLSGNNKEINLTNVSFDDNSAVFNATTANDGAVVNNVSYTYNMTFEILYKTSKPKCFLIDSRKNNSLGYQPLYLYGNKEVQTYISSDEASVSRLDLNVNLTDNTIHLITIVFNNDTTYIYVDGDLAITRKNNLVEYTGNLYLGRRFTDTSINQNLVGNIYAFRLYNQALTSEEINNNYTIDKARFNLQ